MARKPSERRNFVEHGMELNLTPMMNMIAILIPALLISVAFIEVTTLEARAPAISPDNTAEPAPDAPLNLTVTITERGYRVATRQTGAEEAPAIPLVQRPISCQAYRGTRPPPRQKNAAARPCTAEDDERAFWVYDTAGLQTALGVIKDDHPTVRRIVIVAEPDISYEAITDVMDASREQGDTGGSTRILFDEVLLSPTL